MLARYTAKPHRCGEPSIAADQRKGIVLAGGPRDIGERAAVANAELHERGPVRVAVFEGGESLRDLIEVGEVVGVDDLALHDGEVDLALVQPGGVHRQDEAQLRPLALKAFHRASAPAAGEPPRVR